MTYPLTPRDTYTNNSVPKITADAANDWQFGTNALAWPTYLSRPEVKLVCTDGAQLTLYVQPLMIKDAVLGKYRYVPFNPLTATPAQLDTPAANWPASKWLHVYVYSENQVGKVEVSETAPENWAVAATTRTPSKLFKTGDETRRYVGAFRTGAGGAPAVRKFQMLNFEYTNLEQVVGFYVDTNGDATWTNYKSIDLAAFVGPNAVSVGLLTQLRKNDSILDVDLMLSPNNTSSSPIIGASSEPWNGGGSYYPIRRSAVQVPLLSTTIYAKLTKEAAQITLEVNTWKE